MRIIYASPLYKTWHAVKTDLPENPHFYRTDEGKWMQLIGDDNAILVNDTKELETLFQAIYATVQGVG